MCNCVGCCRIISLHKNKIQFLQSHPVVTKLTIPIAMILACGIVLLLVGVCLMWKISCSDSISKRRKTHKNKVNSQPCDNNSVMIMHRKYGKM